MHHLKEEIPIIKKNQMELLEMEAVIQEIKISLENIKSRLDHAEIQSQMWEKEPLTSKNSLKRLRK